MFSSICNRHMTGHSSSQFRTQVCCLLMLCNVLMRCICLSAPGGVKHPGLIGCVWSAGNVSTDSQHRQHKQQSLCSRGFLEHTPANFTLTHLCKVLNDTLVSVHVIQAGDLDEPDNIVAGQVVSDNPGCQDVPLHLRRQNVNVRGSKTCSADASLLKQLTGTSCLCRRWLAIFTMTEMFLPQRMR